VNYFPRLALNYNLPDLSLTRSQDYRHELPVPRDNFVFDGSTNSSLTVTGWKTE
jgi:hypothetical protein